MLLAFAPADAASDSATARASSEQCRAEALDFHYGLGPAEAPTLLRVYIDPTAPEFNPLRTWLELRRLVGERAGELRIEMVPSRSGLVETDVESDALRLWFMAVASLGRAEEALRLLDRQDWMRVAAELRSPEGQARLARELDLDVKAIEARRTGVPGACLRRNLEQASNRLAAQTMGSRQSLVGVVGSDGREKFEYIDVELTELREKLDRLMTVPSFIEEPVAIPFMPPIAPGYGTASRFDRTFPDTGVLVGGEALPHRLIIFIEDEEHGKLPDWLAPAMRFRTAHPGTLSVQLIAAGVGTRAISLRRRLCAARTLGLEVEYLLHLAQPPAVRRLHETELYELLQPVADSDQCSDSEPLEQPGDEEAALSDGSSRRTADFGHPRGAWLDGRPVNPSDLESLEWQLDNEIQPSLIDWLTTPDTLVINENVPEF